MTSKIGFLRLRHFPSRWLKNAGAKYKLICKPKHMFHKINKTERNTTVTKIRKAH